MKVVLDTNVIVKWYTREKGRDKAIEVLNKCETVGGEIIAPESLLQEFKNILVHKYGLNERAIEVVVNDLQNLRVLKLVKVDDNLNSKALNIADKYDITVYDAIFVALAQSKHAEFITADQKLYNKVFPHFNFVKLLGC